MQEDSLHVDIMSTAIIMWKATEGEKLIDTCSSEKIKLYNNGSPRN